MEESKDMDHILTMDAPGASPEDAQRGIDAARAVFEQHGTTAWKAARSAWRREYDDVSGEHFPMTDRDHDAADAWTEAHVAALAACYNGKPPSDAAQIRVVPVIPKIEVWKP